MDILLVPGFWLDASSWEQVTPPLVAAGHRVHPLTLPGLESRDADRAGIGLRDHIDFVVRQVDALDGEVVLVGHSGGGAIIHGVADARPDRIACTVFVDSEPLPAGDAINDELTADGDDVPLPPWDEFEEMDLVDLDESIRADFVARAVPQPRGVAFDPIEYADARRLDVPATVVCCEFTSTEAKDAIADREPWVAELAALRDVTYVDLPTGHWPQFTRPADLARFIVEALRDR